MMESSGAAAMPSLSAAAGPPFSVEQPEVEALFAAPWRQELLERRDILDQEPRFREEGLSALATAVRTSGAGACAAETTGAARSRATSR